MEVENRDSNKNDKPDDLTEPSDDENDNDLENGLQDEADSDIEVWENVKFNDNIKIGKPMHVN